MAADIGLSDAELDALAARVEARLQDRVDGAELSRRELLTLLAGGTAGAAALGGGAAATGVASADADTNDSDGDVGQPGDRVDVFADGVDSVSVDTEARNNAEFVGQHDSVQAAFDAAGPGGTVIFDPSSPTLTSEPSLYDNQTIVLETDLTFDVSSASSGETTFNCAGLTGVKIVANGHEIDGQSRQQADNAARAVYFADTTTDCHIVGTLRVRRMYDDGVGFQGDACTADTIIAETIGDRSNNSSQGDAVNLGSTAQATDCTIETVIGTDCARHTVACGSSGAIRCSIGTVVSEAPGGAHVAFEYAEDTDVGTVTGRDGRKASTYSSELDYTDYGEIPFLNAGGTPTVGCTIGRVISENPNGSGPCVEFGNSCADNSVDDLTSRQAAGPAVSVGSGAGDAPRNHVGVRRIVGAAAIGVRGNQAKATEMLITGVGAGVIRECDDIGVYNAGNDDVEIRGLTIRANIQSGTGLPYNAGIYLANDQFGVLLADNKVADGSSGAQDTGIAAEHVNGISQIRYLANDTIDATTPWDVDGASNTDSAKAGNVPSPTL